MSEKKIEKQRQLAAKSLITAFLLSSSVPPIGYFYTKRWFALIISLLFEILFSAALTDKEALPGGILLLGLLGAICSTHNLWLIRKARWFATDTARKTKEKSDQPSESASSSDDLEIKLLQLLQENTAGATLADFMLATHLKPAEIKTALQELEEHDAVRPTLRDQDGALIYQIVST